MAYYVERHLGERSKGVFLDKKRVAKPNKISLLS